jgi:hypothetical protein
LITGKQRENVAGVVALCFDTNIYINFTKGAFGSLVEQIRAKIDAEECILLVNDIIITEWNRNKAATIHSVTSSILNESKSAKKIAGFIDDAGQKQQFLEIINQYLSSEQVRIRKATDLVNQVEDLLVNRSVNIEVTDVMRLESVSMALDKRAPFVRKSNSVADALIILSAISYVREHGYSSIFISDNFTEFGEAIRPGEQHALHHDLEPIFATVGMRYFVNPALAMNLAQQYIEEYNEYMESVFDYEMHRQMDMERGK